MGEFGTKISPELDLMIKEAATLMHRIQKRAYEERKEWRGSPQTCPLNDVVWRIFDLQNHERQNQRM